jgi:hypothetical protein
MGIGGIRADVEFLRERGLLMRHLKWVHSHP